jgi:hypothetical protein
MAAYWILLLLFTQVLKTAILFLMPPVLFIGDFHFSNQFKDFTSISGWSLIFRRQCLDFAT